MAAPKFLLLAFPLLLTDCPFDGGEWPGEPLCIEHTLDVQLAPDAPELWTVAGELCLPWHGTDRVEVLVHGATYARGYWDRHVAEAVDRGHATFAYDRLGSGASERPPGELVGVDASAYVNAQVIDALRDGTLGDFDEVVLVGHSFGSLIANANAAAYPNVDAVVLTGFAHQATQEASDATQASVYPAQYDPKFAGLADPNYFTTIPGTRADLFFSADVDPATLEQDEVDKDMLSLGLLLDIPRHFSTESLAIDVPVLMVLGTEDRIYCGEAVDCAAPATYQGYESGFFAGPVTTVMVDGAGHSLALHGSAEATAGMIVDWIDATL